MERGVVKVWPSWTRMVLLLALAIGAGTGVQAHAQAPSALTAYFVEVDPDQFDWINQNPWTDHYIPVAVTVDGQRFESVRMRIRGDTSRGFPKKSFKLQFDGAALPGGTTTLNLNADYLDLSYTHTVVATKLIRRSGYPVFEARHARLYINGAFYGLYVEVENMDEDFLRRNGMDPLGNLYKATLDGACLSIFDNVSHHWEKKTNENGDREDLIALIETINAVPQAEYEGFLRDWFDYDEVINILAMNMLLANGSTYYHNYYMYRDARGSGKWRYLNWDLDFSMATYGTGYTYQRSSGSSTPDNPFLERALLSEAILEDVRTRIVALTEEFFHRAYVDPLLDSLATLLEPSVAEDTRDQIASMTTWQQRLVAEKSFIEGRPFRLLEQIDNHPRSFMLDREPELHDDGLTFRWTPSRSPVGRTITYTFRLGRSASSSSPDDVRVNGITDTTFTLTSIPAEGTYFWRVEATDGAVVIDGYDTWNPVVIGGTDRAPIVINEINYNGGPAADWIELYNPLNTTVDLSGWSFNDGGNSFHFPPGTSVEPFSYMIVTRDAAAFTASHGAAHRLAGNFGFGLSSQGERLRIVNALGETIDDVYYEPAAPWPAMAVAGAYTLELINPDLDNALPESWSRSADPMGSPGRRNGAFVVDSVAERRPEFRLAANYPNPFNSATTIEFDVLVSRWIELAVYDALGRKVRVLVEGHLPAGRHRATWDAGHQPSGTYFYSLTDGHTLERRVATLVR